MWHVDHELDRWFEDLRAEAERDRGGGRRSLDDDDGPAPMMQNALAAQLRRGRR